MARIKDLNSALPGENDAFAFDGINGTKRISYAEFKQKLIDDGFGSGSSEAVVLTQAEYDALSDELKDSDTIFFISDAPFENSNVVTLTRAEYNALSDATKNDGRFYYVTDEEEVAKSLVVQTNVNSADTVPSSAVVYSGLNSKVNTSDIVNALNDSSTSKPLSAKMGKQLNDSLSAVDSRTLNGTANAFTNDWNLNDVTTPGVYRFTKAPNDAPSWLNNTFGSVIVTKSSNYVVQVVVYGQISGITIRFCNINYPSTWYDFQLQKKT